MVSFDLGPLQGFLELMGMVKASADSPWLFCYYESCIWSVNALW